MSTNLTPAERAAWNAIGHDQTHWSAVQKALAAALPVHAAEATAHVRAELDDIRGAYRIASSVADRFRDVVCDAIGFVDENPGDDEALAELRRQHGRTGPEPRRWRDVCAGALATLDQIHAGRRVTSDVEEILRAAVAFPDAVQVDPASPPQSTETAEPSTPDDPDTPDAVEAAAAWLLRDHDERVETGVVRPASERAAELVDVIREADAATPIPAVDIPAWREMGDSCGG